MTTRRSRLLKTPEERRLYIKSVSGTAEIPDTTSSDTTTSGREAPPPSPTTKRPVAAQTRAKKWFGEHLHQVIPSVVAGVILLAVTRACNQYSDFNRELGQVSTKVDGLTRDNDETKKKVGAFESSLPLMDFMVRELWQKLFKAPPPPLNPAAKN